ncbi:polyprenyl p-hydroxybenzoate/phenylacrylic acid decarboxylase [Candidatus Magnetobacterium bavaricum]|uniref:Flavin prenyltransferase UbiX n=1 Tax=Candidatus Magnetobacterium bavaricum TaxID=29290 RepID=A0A0F3GXU9_9BACT|nr:polyprenyl p-hydroxybenzoate/phenylacrylic acid decarboxylase [Candidatus Magnetobacterium bavaricum]
MKRYVVAITGASGSVFALRLIESLVVVAEVHLIISSEAIPIIALETGLDLAIGAADSGANGGTTCTERLRRHFNAERLFFYSDGDCLHSPLSSGSFITDGMYVVPCSMKTLSGIANGYADNLIIRAADVVIKEGRPLVLSPREMPFSAIHLENMLKLSRLGVVIAPPVPAFYSNPADLNDIIAFITGKLLDCMSIPHNLFRRWQGAVSD